MGLQLRTGLPLRGAAKFDLHPTYTSGKPYLKSVPKQTCHTVGDINPASPCYQLYYHTSWGFGVEGLAGFLPSTV